MVEASSDQRGRLLVYLLLLLRLLSVIEATSLLATTPALCTMQSVRGSASAPSSQASRTCVRRVDACFSPTYLRELFAADFISMPRTNTPTPTNLASAPAPQPPDTWPAAEWLDGQPDDFATAAFFVSFVFRNLKQHATQASASTCKDTGGRERSCSRQRRVAVRKEEETDK